MGFRLSTAKIVPEIPVKRALINAPASSTCPNTGIKSGKMSIGLIIYKTQMPENEYNIKLTIFSVIFRNLDPGSERRFRNTIAMSLFPKSEGSSTKTTIPFSSQLRGTQPPCRSKDLSKLVNISSAIEI